MRLLLLLSLWWSAAARAQDCGFTINMNSFVGNVGDTAQTNSHVATVTRGQNSADGNCSRFQVFFGKGLSNNYQRRAYSGTNSLAYNIYRSVSQGNILKDYGDAGPGEFLDVLSPAKFTAYSASFYISIPDLNSIFQSSPAGVYTDVVPLNFYNVKSNGTLEYQTTRYLTLSFNLPRYAELSIVPENSAHDRNATSYVMDFGVMEQNEELRADLWIKGNVGYGVMMSSLNGGRLAASGVSTSVPYQIRVGNGGYQTLAGAGASYTMAQNPFSTSSQGERYSLRVKLGTFGQLEGGDYQDVITITVQAW